MLCGYHYTARWLIDWLIDWSTVRTKRSHLIINCYLPAHAEEEMGRCVAKVVLLMSHWRKRICCCFGSVWTLSAELKKKIERRKGNVGIENEERYSCKSKESIYISPVFFRKLPSQWSSKVEYLTRRNLLQTNIRRDVYDQFVKDFFTLYLDSRFYAIFWFWRDSPQWARASSFTTFQDHTQWRTTVSRTRLDAWSARRRDLHLTTHNTHNKHPCPRRDSNPQSQQTSGRRPTL